MDKNIGKKLDGRYEITELIGVGGMADVYKGTDVIDNKPVAIKILKNEFAENEDFLRRFRNESKAIAVLSHPNIVKIYDVGFSDKIQYIIMEYIDGITLKEYIEEEQVLTWKDTVHFIIQILRALQHAHDKGVVHRDIKPQNIMMFTDGTIKVMDFGIAKFAREEGKTATDQAIGSVHYISPEQARGDVTDERSDIYSVGIMMYEMLTGRKPFDSDNSVAIAVMHMHDIPERPKAVNPDIPGGLEEIVLRAMEKLPEDRYQNTSEMIEDIEAFKNNPDISFGYYVEEDEDENENEISNNVDGSTRYFEPVNANGSDNLPSNGNQDNYDDYPTGTTSNDDADGEEEEQRSSLVVPVLTAVTIVVIIVAVVFVASLVKNMITGDSNTGYSKMPSDGNCFLDVLEHAEFALKSGIDSRCSICAYESSMHDAIIGDNELEKALSDAIDNNELKLFYQPKIEIATGKFMGVEALVRWIKPDGTIIAPSYFVPIAESSHLIGKISDFVLNEACDQNMLWQRMGYPPIIMSINFTSDDFYKKDLKERVFDALVRSGLNPEWLEVELTERMALRDVDYAVFQMNQLRDLGVKLAMDDFGTGYSSLSYIQILPITLLKLDRSFIIDIENDPIAYEIVSAVIKIAKSKKIETIAEGIESPRQATILRETGCDYAQGYLYGKPMPADEIPAFFEHNASERQVF